MLSFFICFCVLRRDLHVWLNWFSPENLEATAAFCRVPVSDLNPDLLGDVQVLQLRRWPLVTARELDYTLNPSLRFTILLIWAASGKFKRPPLPRSRDHEWKPLFLRHLPLLNPSGTVLHTEGWFLLTRICRNPQTVLLENYLIDLMF